MGPAKILSILVAGMVAVKQASAQCDGMGVTWGRGIGPPPAGCGRPATGGGAGGGACANPPCTASHLGQIAATVVSGGGHAVGTAVYGPFEAGFTAQQDNILARLGCATGQGYVEGGIDTNTAEQMVAADCNVELPRYEGSSFVSLLDACGHHANHFHEHFGCLWEGRATAAMTQHSVRIAAVDGVDDQFLYGKYEDEARQVFAEVDACGGHFGFTPESPTVEVYHYHVQDLPPFTLGCIGPAADGGLMTVEECRALDSGCGDGDTATLAVPGGDIEYDLWCPCYDGAGSNVGDAPRAIFAGSTAPATTTRAAVTAGTVTTTAEAEDTTAGTVTTTAEAEDTTEDAGRTDTTAVAADCAGMGVTWGRGIGPAPAGCGRLADGNVTGDLPAGTRPVSTGARSTGARRTHTRGTGGRPAGGRPHVTGARTAGAARTTGGPVVTSDSANTSPVAQSADQGDSDATGTRSDNAAAADAEDSTIVLAATAVVAMLVLIVSAVAIRSHRRKGEGSAAATQRMVTAQHGQQRDFVNPTYEQPFSVNRQDSAAVRTFA